ncbi:xylan 1,4-beta-xylosidase [Limosilactobacillus sp. STM2_1]|uniref:Xylan 1,4-beta-xylosidase n=2 Tax=Limosilactobacillus rudii TaxID=2759755 RepID=A0A7W3UM01_9LACO|nr:xylan 1,4-beta-xylosidase [Limosilactobacillus rudii]MBB1098053.1 xylan 1,4-beta-xylosidase [Limosilactobacillus rudii]
MNCMNIFNNNAFKCIGTGRLELALRKEYIDELKYIQRTIGFSYIRGHGLFSDDVGIYQEREEDGKRIVEYNFNYLDQIMDSFKELNIKPFLELDFMPEKLASGKETVFYWRGNITPPKYEKEWVKLVQVTLEHLLKRYGKAVLEWPVEVWNEPNLVNFWKNADKQEYFKFFEITFNAVKEVNKKFKVGGPAICGVNDKEWLQTFINFCEKEKLDIDFITRHFYTVNVVPTEGHYRYPKLRDLKESLEELETSRKIIDKSRYKNLPMYITEFSTSYSPDAPIHDTVHNAAYVADMLSKLGKTSEMYSYWTFGDVFEENGIPFTNFYGGFGLLARHCICKPTYWTFYFYKQLYKYLVEKTDNWVITKNEDNEYSGVIWNYKNEKEIGKDISILLPQVKGKYSVILKKISEKCGNPLLVWHGLGEPASLTKEEVKLLKDSAVPEITTKVVSDLKNSKIKVCPDSVVYFKMKKIHGSQDTGYSYSKLI